MEIFGKERDAVLKEFLKQYPKYNDDKYLFKVESTHRFEGDYSVFVFDGDDYETEFWCKLWNNEQETTYVFEETSELDVMKIRPTIEYDEDFYVYYDYNPNDYTREEWLGTCAVLRETDYEKIETNVVNQFAQENENLVRQYIASKILDGSIPIKFSCVDTDTYNVPLNHLKQKIYKV